MIFEQHYLECLSQASYFIADEGTRRAVVVDPRRDIDEYVATAEEHGVAIELILETHFHADFLSGHLELAARTGAQIAFGSRATPGFPARVLHDGERISLGDVTLEILETPGHTPESVSVVVYEHASDAVPYGVLTGDTLFIGDVGRPDLLSSFGSTSEELASMLYDSIQNKLLSLPDATRVFPGHGAGSACGKNLSTELTSTIGEQRVANYALRAKGRDEFIQVVTEGQPPAPLYFSHDAMRNRESHELFSEHDRPDALTLGAVLDRSAARAVLLDTRDAPAHAIGHLIGSVNVGLDGRYAQYVGSVVHPDEEIVLIAEPGTELEATVRLGRIGYDRIVGYLENLYGSFLDRPELVEPASRLSALAFVERARHVRALQLVDVRNEGEVEDGSIAGAVNVPLPQLRERLGELDESRPTVVFCAGGYRSSIAASLLRRSGFSDVSDILGGYEAWRALTSRERSER